MLKSSWKLALSFSLFLTTLGVLVPGTARADRDRQTVILGCSRPCDGVVAAVRGIGGELDFKYENVDAVAMKVDTDRLPELITVSGVKGVFKDAMVPAPRPVEGARGAKGLAVDALQAAGVQALSQADVARFAASLPADFAFNNDLVGASALHAQGKLGQGVVVGVIDTGTTNSAVVADLTGTVAGGENFVPTDPVQSATSRRNAPHGTWVGTVISGHAAFFFSSASSLVRSLKIHAPGSVIDCGAGSATCPAGQALVPVIGTAPASRIYALKVFDSRGGGSPESRVIAAMDRAITLKRNFNNGMPSVPVAGSGSEEDPFKFNSLNIQVVNMSLGGGTLFAGRDVEDQLTSTMLDVGITLASSAGNDGFPAMSVGSPGTGIGSLTLAAANTPAHERILRDVQFGVGIGVLFRPTTHVQTADFSSRGPNADGRLGPNVIANGFATFAQGTCQGSAGCLAGTAQAPFSFVSGTSFSSPTAAGVAALLRREVPGATASQIRNAIIQSANPALLGDRSGRIDQGNGFLAASAALSLLQSGRVSSRVRAGEEASDSVRENVEEAGFRIVDFDDGRFTAHLDRLVPGQVAQFFVPTRRTTDRLVVTVRNVTPENATAQQNQLFGDDTLVEIADAPTSFSEFRAVEFVATSHTFTIDNPQTGLVRVAIQGDWTNAGRVSADLEITHHRGKLGPETAEGKVAQDDLIPVLVNVPAGTQRLDFALFWDRDWSRYPTNDVDLILLDPAGNVNFDGATFSSPERAVVTKPAAGVWTAFVNGFTINGRRDDWQLRVTADGVRLGAR